MRKRWIFAGIGSFLVTVVLLITIILPAIDPRYALFKIQMKEDEPPSLGSHPYGDITGSISNSFEWDTSQGDWADMVRLGTSEYYLVVSRGSDSDFFAYTLKVWDSNGTIRKTVVDTVEYYSASSSQYPAVCHVSGDVYAASVSNSVNQILVITFSADDANGDLSNAAIDTLSLRFSACTFSDIMNVNGNIYAVSYANSTFSGGWLETVYIDTSGNIGATVNDTVRINGTYFKYNKMESIDSNTIAVAYEGSGTDGYVSTWDISSTGDITTPFVSEWEFDNSRGATPNIRKVYGNVYAISYGDPSEDLQVKTLTIGTDGTITKAWIDTLTIDTDVCLFPTIFPVNNLATYGVTYKGNTDGWVKTFNMSSAGSIDAAVFDSLEYDTVDSIWYAPVSWVANDYYLIVYTGTGNDGWSCVVNITTNYASPTFSTPQPTNGSTGIHIQPRCNITINDLNGDAMTLSWWSNYSDGTTWVHYQTNSSCSNGTYRWGSPFADYATKYWWKVYCNDTIHNSTAWYYFTTEDEPISETWQVINSSINGSIKNLTVWKQTVPPCGINGSIKNISAWRSFSTSINGSIKNLTLWQAFSTALNGSIKNTTIWRGIVPPCEVNGSIKNLSGWVTIISSINGSIKNLSYWSAFSTNINGSIKNISAWRTISAAINGSIKNVSGWVTISSSFNGSIKNITSWRAFSTSINGSIKNVSGWITIGSSINGSIKNLSGWFVINSSINGSIKNLSGGITLISYYPINASTGIPRNVTLRITIHEEAGLPMNITWTRDNYATYLGSHIDVYNGTYYMFSNASLANHRYNWSFNITNGLNWFNQSQWYQTGNTFAGGGAGGGYTNKRITTYFVLGACMGTLTGGLVLNIWRKKKRQ